MVAGKLTDVGAYECLCQNWGSGKE